MQSASVLCLCGRKAATKFEIAKLENPSGIGIAFKYFQSV